MKKKLLIPALCLAIATTAAFVLLARAEKPGKHSSSEPNGGERKRESTPVRTLVLKPQALDESIVASGTVRADESIDVQPEIAGRLIRINFEEGSRVQAGDLLAVINDAELRASLQRAVYRRELAELKTRRINSLIDKGGVPQQEYDIAASELSVLGAEVELIQAQLARTEVRAPFAGVVGLRNVSEGAQVSTATRLTTLQKVTSMKLDFTVPEKYAAVLTPGRTVSFSVAGSDRIYSAEIYAVEPRLDEITRTRLIRARAPNPDQTLLPGAFARVEVPLGHWENALMVPTTAVAAEAGEKAVFVVEKGKASRRVVQTGLRLAESVLITSGLQAGDEVIVTGVQLVRPGASIDTSPAN